jgi:glycosyltransferase involved in cell wall biosynthesis
VFNFIPSFRSFDSRTAKLIFFVKQLFKIIYVLFNNKEIKLVHLHSSKDGSFYRKLLIAVIAKGIFGKKTINHIHSGNFKRFYEGSNWLAKKLIQSFLKMNNATITVSEFWKSYFKTFFNIKNVYKVHNMVEPGQCREVANFDNGPVKILFLGLVDQHKGIFDLLKVLADNRKLLENRLKLTIGGNGQINQLKKVITSNNLSELIEYKGWVIGEEKQKLIQNSDVFILPSYYEGLPISILEAMSFGKAIISTPVGGIPEVVEHGVNGLLITPGDYNALLNALLFYIKEPENIQEHGIQSLNKIKDYWPDVIVPQLETIYCSLLA